jgi:hypothetical protein
LKHSSYASSSAQHTVCLHYHWELASVPVEAYAKYMAGVDRLDQNIRLNKEKKTMRWYRRIETKLRECALYNAYIIEGTVVNHFPPNKQKRDLLSHWMDVAHPVSLFIKTLIITI